MILAPLYMLAMLAVAFSRGRWAAPCVALLLCFSTATTADYADFPSYVNYYAIVQTGGTPTGLYDLPAGWFLLNRTIAATGLSVRGFVCVVLVLCVFLTARFYRRVGCERNLHWCLFLLFPALVQCVQLRFFLGFSIVLLSFAGIVNGERFGILRYVVGVLVASTIHSSMLVFLVLAPAGKLGGLGVKKAALVVASLALMAYLCVGYVPGIAASLLNDVKYERYFVSDISTTTGSWFMKILFIWASAVVLSYANVRVLGGGIGKAKRQVAVGDKRGTTLLVAVALTGITLPLLQFDSNFHRFIEMGFMLSYVLFSYFWQSGEVPSSHKLLLLLCFLVLGAIAAYVYEPFPTVIEPLLSYDGFHSLLG